ncbi:MAG TPA: DEAD/DEAH box helicase [Acidimicrobiales bacterium]|nr:DEAD/DEAH box helicase [Acidimicrobiales bacterium]
MSPSADDGVTVVEPSLEPVDVLERLGGQGQLRHLRRLPARAAAFAEPGVPFTADVAAAVPPGGLWSHQAAAVDLARSGRSVAVATGTASGKSLCYQLPVAEAVAEGGTALLLFPTKALARDQLSALAALAVPGLVAASYDGDTTPDERAWARRHASVLLSNPDMLHVGILPNHARWAGFLSRLRYVVVDEMHVLRGVFGSHVAHVLRRLRRLCEAYGSDPTFVFTSATIGDAGRLARTLCGKPVAEVTADGSPSGERLIALWNPPLWDSRGGGRASSHGETAALVAAMVASGHRTIAFTRSRRATELVAAAARRRLPAGVADLVRPYRGGYLATERREVEKELFEGRLLGVVATNALELGIDVGGLDVCVLDGFPGTIASMWQQVGRCGRGTGSSLAVLVAGEDSLDQWLMAHPDEVFTRPPEAAVANPYNPFVMRPHVVCAAWERPLAPSDESWWEPGDEGAADGAFDDAIRLSVLDDELSIRCGRAVVAGRRRPASVVGLRSGSSDTTRIVSPDGTLVGTVESVRAPATVHSGAVYLHQGQHYLVDTFDVEERRAVVRAVDPEETTQARSEVGFRILGADASAPMGRTTVSVGAVEVTERVTGYRRRHLATGEVLGDVDLELPPSVLTTRGFWYTVPEGVLARAGLLDGGPELVAGSLHAAEHAAIGMLPLFAICDRWDVGGVSTPWHPDTGQATIVVYDGYPGGAGVAELGFRAGVDHLPATLASLEACPCEGGCPSCVQSPKCGNLNEPLDKAGAIALLRAILA